MAFGGTVKKGSRFDTRRFRRVNPCGPNPEEQAKLLGSKKSLGLRDHDYPRLFCGKIERREMRDPDMTPIPRHMSGQLVRLYLPERTIIAPAVLGDEAFDDFFLARYAPEVVVDERGEPGFMDSNGNVVWPEDEMPLFDGAPRKPEGRRKKGWLRRAKSRLRRKNARRRATLARLVTYPHLAPMVERKLP